MWSRELYKVLYALMHDVSTEVMRTPFSGTALRRGKTMKTRYVIHSDPLMLAKSLITQPI